MATLVSVRPVVVLTGVGESLLTRAASSPSCPYWSLPQQYALPATLTPHMWPPPDDSWAQPPAGAGVLVACQVKLWVAVLFAAAALFCTVTWNLYECVSPVVHTSLTVAFGSEMPVEAVSGKLV